MAVKCVCMCMWESKKEWYGSESVVIRHRPPQQELMEALQLSQILSPGINREQRSEEPLLCSLKGYSLCCTTAHEAWSHTTSAKPQLAKLGRGEQCCKVYGCNSAGKQA